MKKFFRNLYQSKKSKARLGEINTAHGTIKTPAFVPVGTKGTIKALLPLLIKEIKIQVAFVNTYHLVTHPGAEIIEKAGGIHKFANLSIPLMSDSGGFQVFSLANSKVKNQFFDVAQDDLERSRMGQKSKLQVKNQKKEWVKILQDDGQRPERPMIEKISDDGVRFRSVFDGELIEFTPEKSMKYQKMIGADINMALDECTYYPSSHNYASKAMDRTHKWLTRCINQVKNQKSKIKSENKNSKFQILDSKFQFLYGVIQGATFEDLRKKSAEFVVSQNIDGVAIGGVSVGETKKEMREQVEWVAEYLSNDKPVHLLGVGQVDDIIDLVKQGIDTFDCVEPTRLARMGVLYRSGNVQLSIINDQSNSKLKFLKKETDILQGKYRYDLSRVDEGCDCYVCQNFTKAYLHHLFKQREILGYNLATYHNLWVMERLMEGIRMKIKEDEI